jgi:hypothetical protein
LVPLVEFASARLRGVGPAVVVDVNFLLPLSAGDRESPSEECGSAVVVILSVKPSLSSKNLATASVSGGTGTLPGFQFRLATAETSSQLSKPGRIVISAHLRSLEP